MIWITIPCFTLIATFAGVALVRRFAVRNELIDVPNERSSHVVPTPSGGGLAMAVVFSLVTLVLWSAGQATTRVAIAYLIGGCAVAVVGFIDDRRSVPARFRLLVHVLSVVWAVSLLWPAGHPDGFEWLPEPILAVFLILAGVWLLNLFNFMDGIDGIAAAETITAAFAAALILALGERPELAIWPLTLAAAAGGFLYWNWSPARIFMGDVGSGFLGFVIGVMALHTSQSGAISAWSWIILLAVFITDATTTLLRRVLNGDDWYRPHRTHAYQHLAAARGHPRVTVSVAVVNLLWLLPIAWLATRLPALGPALAALAYAPLVFLAHRAGAGRRLGSALAEDPPA